MSPAPARVALERGHLEIEWPGLASMGRLLPRVLLTDGQETVGEAWRRARGAADTFVGACGPVNLELRAAARGRRVRLEIRAIATATAEIAEVGLAAVPAIEGQRPQWMVHSGYQSWDAAGVVPSEQPSAEPVKRQSWWTCGLASPDGTGIGISAMAGRRTTTRFDLRDGRLVITGSEPSGLARWPLMWSTRRGDRWAADPLVLTASADVRDALGAVAGMVKGRAGANGALPQGWLSWYHYGPWINFDEVVQNADALAAGRLQGLGYRTVQLDDGWQEAYGDWTPNHKFRRGIAALAEEVNRRQQVLGIWTAPFLVSATSDLARQAPDDWFVKDPTTGERAVDPVHMVFGPMHVLDARRPAVRRHLEEVFGGLYAAGVRYFKIDFLYAGGYAGTRAVRQGVQAIRKAVKDSYLLACGAPLLPMAGLADGCRIGRDTATPLYDFEIGSPKPTLLGDEIIEVGRNQAARHFLKSWFQLDPDVALVGGNLTLDQARTCVTICALSGGPFFASDDLDALEQERLDLLTNRDVLALAGGEPARPDWDPQPKDLPASVWRRNGTVAVFNWGHQDREFQLEVDAGAATDLWTGRRVGVDGGRARLDVPAAGVRLIRLERG